PDITSVVRALDDRITHTRIDLGLRKDPGIEPLGGELGDEEADHQDGYDERDARKRKADVADLECVEGAIDQAAPADPGHRPVEEEQGQADKDERQVDEGAEERAERRDPPFTKAGQTAQKLTEARCAVQSRDDKRV